MAMNRNSELLDAAMNILQDTQSTDDMLCEAAHQILELGDKDASGTLYNRLSNFHDPPWVRREIVLALGGIIIRNKLDLPKANSLLLKILSSTEDEEVREMAAISLGHIREIRAVLPLINILESGEDRLLFACITALGSIGDTRAIDYLIKYLDVDVFLIPQTAAKGLGRFGAAAEKALPALINLAKRGNKAERREANAAIVAIKSDIEPKKPD